MIRNSEITIKYPYLQVRGLLLLPTSIRILEYLFLIYNKDPNSISLCVHNKLEQRILLREVHLGSQTLWTHFGVLILFLKNTHQ